MVRLKEGGERRALATGCERTHALDPLRKLPILETQPEDFLKVLRDAGVATNVYLRRIHNFALDMNWLPWPVMPKRQWPKISYRKRRGHHRRRAAGDPGQGEQSGTARLLRTGLAHRRRSVRPGLLDRPEYRLGPTRDPLPPQENPQRLHPQVQRSRGKHSREAAQSRTPLSGISRTLHSYRYSWAERAKSCGYPERFAQVALGHNSRAVHEAYASGAAPVLPALDEYENTYRERVIPLAAKAGR